MINIFTLKEPANQQRLVALLVEATDTTMKRLPGFISANIHRSLDGKKVINYARWRTKADFEAIRKDPSAAGHMKAAAELAEFEPIVCEVADAIGVA